MKEQIVYGNWQCMKIAKSWLDDTQNEEMCSIVQSIGDDDLENLYVEGEKHGVGKLMKEIWITDDQQRNQLFDDQAKNSMLVK